jgi:hypothetical protein
MTEYTVISESEEVGCWIYEVDLASGDGIPDRLQLRLAWEDYDLWVRDGSIEPARVANALLRFALDHQAFQPTPARIDSSHPRRFDPSADDEINRLIRDIHA